MMKINNLPAHITENDIVVVREVDGALWFYNIWYASQADEAMDEALEVDGFLVKGARLIG